MNADSNHFRLSPHQAARTTWIGQTRARARVLVDGQIDVEELGKAFDRVVQRHEILRTSFPTPAGLAVPVQAVAERGAGLVVLDRSGMSAAVALASLDRTGDIDAIDSGPTRVTLVVLGGDRHVLVVDAAGLALDERSFADLVRELVHFLTGAGPEPVDEPLQYADFAAWQQTRVSDDAAATAEANWAGIVPGGPASALPFERPGAVGETALIEIPVAEATTNRLSEIAAEVGADLQAAWLAVLTVAVARRTGETEVAVALEVDGRHHADVEGALGLYATSLPVGVTCAGGMTFVEVVDAARRSSAQALRFRDLRFTGAQEPPSRVSLTTSATPKRCSAGPLDVRFESIVGAADRFSVRLELASADEATGGLEAVSSPVRLLYDTGAIDPTTAESLARSLSTIVGQVVVDPHRTVDDLVTLDPVDRAIVDGFNPPRLPSLPGSVAGMIRAVAECVPDRRAVSAADGVLTYAELLGRARRLAVELRALGVGPDVPVGLYLDRSAAALVGVVGIWEAGGGYAPLGVGDPPNATLRQIEQSAIGIVVTDGPGSMMLAGTSATVVRIEIATGTATGDDGPARSPVLAEGSAAVAPVGPEHLAYVIHTSGSTGAPKGVEVTQANLADYTLAILEQLGMAPGGTAAPWSSAAVSSLSTDLGNTAIFPALASGGCVHLVDADTARDPERFAALMQREHIDLLKITPSHLEALLAVGGAPVLPGRHLYVGGETASWDLLGRVTRVGRCSVTNHYGPTETTVGSCTFAWGTDVSAWNPATVPIGRPLPGSTMYVLDDRRRPVAPGVAGELYIGGAGVARGYTGRPREMLDRFLDDPFSEVPAARMYRTGDLGRFLPDGNIEFLGRIDAQVKIRGHRVEPAEVESAITRHPDVRQATVLSERRADGVRLVAYVAAEPQPTVAELRAFLAREIPEHLIPAVIVMLGEQLPMTASGKVDRRALPAMADDSEGEGLELVAPRSPVEQQLADIWAATLGRERVGVAEDFFALGGHSLVAMQLVARVREAFAVELPLKTLFAHPTVAGQAVVVEQLRAAEDESDELDALISALEHLSDEEAADLLSDGDLSEGTQRSESPT